MKGSSSRRLPAEAWIETGEKMKTKVLIVDDEPIIGNLLEGGLSEAGFEAEYFDNSVKALENIRRVRPDIIISDIAMPHMDGYELRRRLRQDPETAGIPFVFLSARTDPPDQLEGLRMGADDYVYKPFKIENLISRVEIVMERAVKNRYFKSQAEFSGDLPEMSLNDIMQIVGTNHKTGELIFNHRSAEPASNPKNEKNARLCFLKGRLINAQMGDLEGQEAFFGLMGENEGHFEFHTRAVDVPEQITENNMTLLLKGTRMADDMKEFCRQLPDMETVLDIRVGEIPPELAEWAGKENVQHILSMIDKRQSVLDIINCGLMSRIRAGSVLAGLLNAGVAAIPDQLSSADETAKPVRSQAGSRAPSTALRYREESESVDAPMIEKGLVKVLKGFEQGAMTGVLEIRERPSNAAIYFRDGFIIHAYHGHTSGKKALYRAFSEKGGRLKFKQQPVNVLVTIEGTLKTLLEEASKEIESLQRLKSSTFENTMVINSQVLEKTSKIKGRPGLEHILSLAQQSGRIRDIIDASQMTDFQTYRHLFYMVKIGVFTVEADNTAKIQLITDSTADIPPHIISERNIVSVPLSVNPEQMTYLGKTPPVSLNTYRMLNISRTFAASSSPLANDFHQLFQRIAPDKDILAIFLSSKISKTYQNAITAKDKNYSEYLRMRQQKSLESTSCHIEIIDSKMVSLGLGLLVLEASDRIEAGWPVERVRSHIETLISKVRIFFAADVRAGLGEGGHIGKVRAAVGKFLRMKPILGMWNGEITAIDQVISRKKAMGRMLEWIQWSLDDLETPLRVGIMHADVPQWAAQMKEKLEEKLNCQEITVSHVGPSVGSYCGPGTVAVAYFPLPNE
jgi:DegV family protein with EDD domain